eukprot:TRINITY_DN4664_c0_g1_i1.p1 TRINITY_DN4664_c0_g1~~TRINITY_DN4664_c0_g1_i1.p1  ORF type:complete len:199 (+),score=32.09 TRINITY_DN4664_c0_g1_i1:181-777(+)
MQMVWQQVAYQVQGERGLRVAVWRSAIRQHAREEEAARIAAKAAALRTEIESKCQTAGFRMLENVMRGRTFGLRFASVSQWKDNRADFTQKQTKAMMETRLCAMSLNQGVKLLKVVVSQLLQGEIGGCLAWWKISHGEETFSCGAKLCLGQKDQMRAEIARLKLQISALQAQNRTGNIIRGAFYASSKSPGSGLSRLY